ncbi:MAG: hypothetical protein ACFCAD_14795 [Pleurocapsa sp.]
MTRSRFKLPLQSRKNQKKAKDTRFNRLPSSKKHKLKSTKVQSTKPKQGLLLRLFLVWGVLLLGTIGLAARLYYLQIVNPIIVYDQAPKGKRLTQIAQDQQTAKLSFYIPRRQIVDRDQNVLATDRITYTLYVHPHLFKRNSQPVPAEEIAQELSNIIGGKTPEEYLAVFNKQDWGIRLAGDLPESVKEKIAAMKIDGLDLKQNYTRFYPHREKAAEVT